MLKTQGRQTRAALYLVTLLGCLLAFLSFQFPAYSQLCIDWTGQTVDSAGNVGYTTSLAFGSGPAISYFDQTNGDLKFAYDKDNDGDFTDAGEIITVDSTGDVGKLNSLAFGSGPAISYYDETNGDLKFARYSPPVAGIDIDPDTLNLNSKGKWVTCYIELPEGYDVADIDVSTVFLNAVQAEPRPTGIGDYDDDGIPDLMVKFDRSDIQDAVDPGDEVELTVSGKLTGGTPFEGTDTIRVIDKGNK